MTAETSYRYTILRYEHDVRTNEFLNVGILFWLPARRQLIFRHTDRTGRLSGAFPGIESDSLIATLNSVGALAGSLSAEALMGDDIVAIARKLLPRDDSSLKWSAASAGRTVNPSQAIDETFQRLIARYEKKHKHRVRSDHEVWHGVAERLRLRRVLTYLHQATIHTPMSEYTFHHTWQNGTRHAVVPISLDGESRKSLAAKATRWAGDLMDLRRSSEPYQLHLVLGEPRSVALTDEFQSALALLRGCIDDRAELVAETEAAPLVDRIADEIAREFEHGV